MKMTLEFFEKFAENLRVGIVIVDNDDKIVLFNKVAGEMFQMDPKTRIGSSILRCHGEVSEKPVLKMLSKLKNRNLEYIEGWDNFKGRLLYHYIYPLWDDNGVCLGVVEELYDGTEKAEYLKMKGEWKDLHVSGLGKKAPRTPHEHVP
jgi:DUF438 domain-containing protein